MHFLSQVICVNLPLWWAPSTLLYFQGHYRWRSWQTPWGPPALPWTNYDIRPRGERLPSGHQPRSFTHWGRVTHVCVSKQIIIGSDNGLSPGRRQAIIWTNAGIWLIPILGTNFNEILSKIHTFSLKKMHLKMSSGKWRPFCLGLNVLTGSSLCWKDPGAQRLVLCGTVPHSNRWPSL